MSQEKLPYQYDIKNFLPLIRVFLLFETHKKKTFPVSLQQKLNLIPLTHLSEYAVNNNETRLLAAC
jgi:hypothetical protein